MDHITQTCTKCGSQFLVIKKEQEFLQKKQLPLPTKCPGCRQERRLSLRGSKRQLYKASCQKCDQEIIVSFDPKTVTNPVYCRKDYDEYFSEHDPIITDPLP